MISHHIMPCDPLLHSSHHSDCGSTAAVMALMSSAPTPIDLTDHFTSDDSSAAQFIDVMPRMPICPPYHHHPHPRFPYVGNDDDQNPHRPPYMHTMDPSKDVKPVGNVAGISIVIDPHHLPIEIQAADVQMVSTDDGKFAVTMHGQITISGDDIELSTAGSSLQFIGDRLHLGVHTLFNVNNTDSETPKLDTVTHRLAHR